MYFTGRKAAVVYNVVYLQYVCCASRQMYPRNNQYALVEVKTLLFLALIFFYGSLCRKILLMFEYIGLNYIKCRLVCVVSLAGRWTTPRVLTCCLVPVQNAITFDTCRFIGWVNHCTVQIDMWCLFIQTLVYFAFRASSKNYNQSDVTSCIAHNLFQCPLCHLNLTVLK